jgi:TRAP transporter TAXI family solute receptor
MASGIAEAIKTMTGMDVRVLPHPSDMEKLLALKSGTGDVCIWAISSAYFPITGAEIFKKMGPQSLRMVWHANGWFLGLVTRGDSDIKEVMDLKGRRVAYYPGSPGFRLAVRSYLSFAGLTYDDVVKVPVSGYAAGLEAVLTGQAEAAYCGTAAPKAAEIEASRHGIRLLPLHLDDEKGWARILSNGPFYKKVMANDGAGCSPAHPVPLTQASCLITSLPTLDENIAFAIAKVLAEEHAKYVDAMPVELKKWTLEGATRDLPETMPYHPGSIRYFKEIGSWPEEAEAWQQKMLSKEKQRTAGK